MTDTKKIIIGVAMVFALILTINSFFIVGQQQVAITKTLGKVNEKIYTAGFNVKTPLITNVIKYSIQTHKYEDDTTSASKDLQNVTTRLAVTFAIEQNKVIDIYTNLGKIRDVENKIIYPSIQEVVKQSTSQFTAEQLITKRNEVSSDIINGLKEKVSVFGVRVVDVNIVDFKFSEGFDSAIEAKVRAEQDALAQKNLLEKVKYESEQKVVKARAEAEAIKIQAEAVKSQGGREYVQLQWIEKWDGKLPETTLGGDSSVLIGL